MNIPQGWQSFTILDVRKPQTNYAQVFNSVDRGKGLLWMPIVGHFVLNVLIQRITFSLLLVTWNKTFSQLTILCSEVDPIHSTYGRNTNWSELDIYYPLLYICGLISIGEEAVQFASNCRHYLGMFHVGPIQWILTLGSHTLSVETCLWFALGAFVVGLVTCAAMVGR